MHKVAVIVGSDRKGSINRKFAEALVKLGEEKLAFEIVEIGELPLFSQNIEADAGPEVARYKERMAAAEAFLFVTPEHNRSIPAAMKNAIDWATRPPGHNELQGKPGAITGTSKGALGTVVAQHHLRSILAGQLSAILGAPAVYFQTKDGLIDDDGAVTDEKTRVFLQTFMDNFSKLVNAMADS